MTKQINDGGPAFPQPEQLDSEGRGMSLREYLAGQALVGLLSSEGVHRAANDMVIRSHKTTEAVFARFAVRQADALLAALATREGGAA